MNPIEQASSAKLLEQLFDEVVVPLAAERRACLATPYFARVPDASAASYYSAPRPSSSSTDYELHGGTADGLLSALSALWTEQGDAELLPLVPALRKVAAALSKEHAESDGSVDVLCYTLF